MKTSVLKTGDIFVRDGLERFRKNMGEIDKLAQSIKRYGQLQPIIITRKLELVAGGRRLAACILLGIDIHVTFQEDLTDVELRLLEVEENIQRKNFTPAEECLAIQELHALKQEQFGKCANPHDTGHTLKDTADLIGQSKASVIAKLKAAAVLKHFPALKSAKTLKEISMVGKITNKVLTRNRAVGVLKDVESFSDVQDVLILEDALVHMKSIKDNLINIVITDPPWGISIDKISPGIMQRKGKTNLQGVRYSDDEKKSLSLYKALASESFRFTTDNSHAYVFLAPIHFNTIRDYFINTGWVVGKKPIIWDKMCTGANTIPAYWPSSSYEVILYARKPASRLQEEGKKDLISVPTVLRSTRIHPAEKPLDLLQQLIRRSCIPGEALYDPFAGSGNALVAGLNEGLNVIGCEIDKSIHNAALIRVKIAITKHNLKFKRLGV